MDLLATQMVASKVLQGDDMGAAWFDYRVLHPVQATAIFMSAYRESHSYVMSRRVDMTQTKLNGIRALALADQPQTIRTGLWVARQHADSLCCPYEFYTLAILSFADKCNYSRLPLPGQLYAENFAEHVAESWRDSVAVMPRFASNAAYAADNFSGHQWQRDYIDYLVETVRGRTHPQYALAMVLTNRHMTVEQAVEYFGEELVDRAYNICREITHSGEYE